MSPCALKSWKCHRPTRFGLDQHLAQKNNARFVFIHLATRSARTPPAEYYQVRRDFSRHWLKPASCKHVPQNSLKTVWSVLRSSPALTLCIFNSLNNKMPFERVSNFVHSLRSAVNIVNNVIKLTNSASYPVGLRKSVKLCS